MEPMVVICPGRPDEMSLVENYFNSDLYIRDSKFENEVNAYAARKVFTFYNVIQCTTEVVSISVKLEVILGSLMI